MTFVCNSLLPKDLVTGLTRAFVPSRGPVEERRLVHLASELFGVRPSQVFFFAAGRMALFTALASLGLPPEAEVLIVGYTCVVVPNAVKYLGLRVRYVDIAPESVNAHVDDIERSLTPATKVVIVAHNFGVSCEGLRQFRQRHSDVVVIEDAAHGFGGRHSDGSPFGTGGHFSFFSFEYSKPLTSGMGGLLIVNDPALVPALAALHTELPTPPFRRTARIIMSLCAMLLAAAPRTRWLGWRLVALLRKRRLLAVTDDAELRGERPAGYPARLPTCLMPLLSAQLQRLPQTLRTKETIVRSYAAALSGSRAVESWPLGLSGSMVRFPIVLRRPLTGGQRASLHAKVESRIGLTLGNWFNDPVHPRGSLRYGYVDGTCPRAESLSQRILNLPVNVHCRPRPGDLAALREIFDELSTP